MMSSIVATMGKHKTSITSDGTASLGVSRLVLFRATVVGVDPH